MHLLYVLYLLFSSVYGIDTSIRLVNGSVLENPSQYGWFRLDLLHTSDVRGHVMPVNQFSSSCSMEEALNYFGSLCFGGVARAATYIRETRSLFANSTILVDTGNYFYGTLFFYHVWLG